jgi:hypothetical protein
LEKFPTNKILGCVVVYFVVVFQSFPNSKIRNFSKHKISKIISSNFSDQCLLPLLHEGKAMHYPEIELSTFGVKVGCGNHCTI